MLPNFYREVVRRIALLYALFIQGGVFGMYAVIAITRDYVIVMRRYL
jgi:hypothetical protein